MDSKNNVLIVVLVIIIAALSGVSLLFGIGNAVSTAVGPMVGQVGQMAATQRSIEQKLSLNKGAADNAVVLAKLEAIDKRLASLEQKVSAPAQRPQAPQPPQPPQEDLSKVYSLEQGSTPIRGKKDAPVTIVMFSDFQCPFCNRFYPPINDVMKAYPNQVKFMVKNYPLPFHPNAKPAAKLAMAANEQGKYYEMVEILMENGAVTTDDKIKEHAKKLGLNLKKLTDDFKNKDAEYEKRIAEDMKMAEASDVRGTPTFFLNGKKTNARDFNGFKSEIDVILAGKK